MTDLSPTDELRDVLAQRRAASNGDAADALGEQAPGGALVAADEAAGVLPASPPPPDYSRVPAKVVGALPYAGTYSRLAHTIHRTELVPKALRNRPDAVMAAMMYGYELGLGPMQALNGVQVIDGKAGLSAELMRALIYQAGHVFILNQSDSAAEARCRRRDWPEDQWATFRWTLADAKRAGVYRRGSSWERYPRAMLSARVTSEAARAVFADVLAGMSYTPEELEDMAVDERGGGAPLPEPEPAPVPETVAEPAPAPVPLRPVIDATTEPAPDVLREMRKALNDLVKSLPRNQQPLVRAFLAKQGYGAVGALGADQVTAACTIVAGWPTSAARAIADAQPDLAPGEEGLADDETEEVELLPVDDDDEAEDADPLARGELPF